MIRKILAMVIYIPFALVAMILIALFEAFIFAFYEAKEIIEGEGK